MMKRLLSVLLVIAVVLPASAQRRSSTVQKVKKPLTQSAYDEWKSITFRQLTPDGKHVVYTLNPEDGDGKVIFQDLSKNTQFSVERAKNIQLSADSKHAAFLIQAQKDSLTQLRRLKKKKEEMPQRFFRNL
jgi:glutamate mutase epsilon subunit